MQWDAALSNPAVLKELQHWKGDVDKTEYRDERIGVILADADPDTDSLELSKVRYSLV